MLQQQQHKQQEVKRAKIHHHQQQQHQQNDDERTPVPPNGPPGPFSTDPAHFAQRIDPNKLALSRPCCIGEFSLDRTRRQQLGRSRVRYFNERTLGRKLRGANLAENFHTFVPKGDEAEGIEQLLHWIMAMSAPNSALRKTVHECDFVLWRGTITRLSISPYDSNAFGVGVKIACTKHKGVYFVSEFDTEAKQRSENNRNDFQRRTCYGGFKFEQLVTVDDLAPAAQQQHHGTASVAEPVDQNNEFVGIFKATLSSSLANDGGGGDQSGGAVPSPLRLLYGAEIDCISPLYGEFMEIKTQYKAIGQGKGFVHKALKWWIQSYLIGIKQMIIGTHENLILGRVELFPVDSLPKLGSSCWSGPVCLQFLFQFLHYIRRCLDASPEGAILVAERQPNAREFKFWLIGPDEADAQREHRVLSDAFKNYLWR
ncbi:hypothetical protein niasHT_030834 [Heterodera trifolii]|uniref:Decapping nuclease n=1 Tax=Heterodera trifolii TaxID=157864 RepID=A0ABD2HXJ8_9BILA